MKKTLLFIALIATSTFFAQTNLVLNGSADDHGTSSDNADAFDMTPPSLLDGDVASPYNAIWNNSALDTYLRDTYNGGSDVDEQPGSTSDGTYSGATKTRGVKLYGDGSPAVSASTRRLYQKIVVEAGETYIFSMESRSEAENIPSQVFMLNEEIVTEAGLENGAADSRVDHYIEVTNDFNASKGGEGNNTFTTTTFEFTATTTTVVIYVRALLANSGETEVFYDNFSLIKKATASVNDVFASKIGVYPNPTSDFINIATTETISKIEVYNVIGKKVISISKLINNKVDLSSLSKGMYILKLTDGNSVATKKIVKN